MATVTQTLTTSNLVARYTHLRGVAGIAFRTQDRRCFFVSEAAEMTELTNADLPALDLLGAVDLADAQYMEDLAAGGYAAIACSRAN
jgi:hypothetical protein